MKLLEILKQVASSKKSSKPQPKQPATPTKQAASGSVSARSKSSSTPTIVTKRVPFDAQIVSFYEKFPEIKKELDKKINELRTTLSTASKTDNPRKTLNDLLGECPTTLADILFPLDEICTDTWGAIDEDAYHQLNQKLDELKSSIDSFRKEIEIEQRRINGSNDLELDGDEIGTPEPPPPNLESLKKYGLS